MAEDSSMMLSVGFNVTSVVAATALTRFQLGKRTRLSTADAAVVSFLIWASVTNFLMGITYSFFGGPTGNVPIFSSMWKDYGAIDARFATVDHPQQALSGLYAFLLAPSAVLLVYQIANNKPTRLFFQAIVGSGYLFAQCLLIVWEICAGMSHVKPDPASQIVFLLANAVYLVFPAMMLYKALIVAGTGRGGTFSRSPGRSGRKSR